MHPWLLLAFFLTLPPSLQLIIDESLPGSQEKHPSALEWFEGVLAAAAGKQIVMFLDYDGTLSPIVEDPERAVMTEEVSLLLPPRGVIEAEHALFTEVPFALPCS